MSEQVWRSNPVWKGKGLYGIDQERQHLGSLSRTTSRDVGYPGQIPRII